MYICYDYFASLQDLFNIHDMCALIKGLLELLFNVKPIPRKILK